MLSFIKFDARVFPIRLFTLVFCVFTVMSCSKTLVGKRNSSSQGLSNIENISTPAYVPASSPYQPTYTKEFDLIHTKLQVSFDWEKQHLLGKADLTVSPHFYKQKQLSLDAKGFEIKTISLKSTYWSIDTKDYSYDGKKISIQLPSPLVDKDTLLVSIEYVAKPNELSQGGGKSISSDKGLYFINPKKEDVSKPMQIWTQGETESSSCWFPTIESPDQKTTQELYITVDSTFQTLSNGTLIYSVDNPDGTRTDYWKQDLPHAPYLVMMAIGKYAIIKDEWREKEVSYYVEPEYKAYAKQIFGRTPQMLEFFSQKLGYTYPWDKYAQVVVRDYVSGAMENTSASIFMEQLQVTDRELLDKNWDPIIAHELFHHWFGDLVTCESWSNLALNESFANYSEYLWLEHFYGKDEADHHFQEELEGYLDEAGDETEGKRVPIIRYHYASRDDLFDAHSYNKGGRVLHMLRSVVGEEAFFESLKRYLTKYAFKSAEIHDLRMVFEEVTGRDLNWFFNQWFLSPGHPELKVSHSYTDGNVVLSVEQLQDTLYAPVFNIPSQVKITLNDTVITHSIFIDKYSQKINIPVSSKPLSIIIDPEHVLLGVIDHDKSVSELLNQYRTSKDYLSRYDAIVDLLMKDFSPVKHTYLPILDSSTVRETMMLALNDPFWAIREAVVESFQGYTGLDKDLIDQKIQNLATSDPKSSVRDQAMKFLGMQPNSERFSSIFKKGVLDSSYSVVASSLENVLNQKEEVDKKDMISSYLSVRNPELLKVIGRYFTQSKDSTQYIWFIDAFKRLRSYEKIGLAKEFGQYLMEFSSMQEAGITFAQKIMLEEEDMYTRYAGYAILNKMNSIPLARRVRIEAVSKETNEYLKGIYKRKEAELK